MPDIWPASLCKDRVRLTPYDFVMLSPYDYCIIADGCEEPIDIPRISVLLYGVDFDL